MSAYKHLTVFPPEDRDVLQDLARETGLSINQIIVRSVHGQAPVIRSEHQARTGRLTNVDPLPEKVLERLYRDREEDEEGIRRLIGAQPKEAR